MAAAVFGRLVGERAAVRSRRRTWITAGLAAAAAIIIAIRISRSPSTVPSPSAPTPGPLATAPVLPPRPVPAPSPVPPDVVATGLQTVSLPELDGLPDGELQAILGSLDDPNTSAPAHDGSGLDNLDDHELEDVLGAWEG